MNHPLPPVLKRLHSIVPAWLCALACFFSSPCYPQNSQAKLEKLGDGVEHWYFSANGANDSYFNKKFAEIYNVVVPDTRRPFGRSIAFLVGVSNYQNLSPQLPSVRNDVKEMRDFLLNKAGFDEVYIAENDIVNRDLVEQYVKEKLPSTMRVNDRLLFYYSGHGGDNQGTTGYMLFSKAKKNQFWGPQVLPIDELNDWSRELRIQHVLFIIDSCASGLAFTSKSVTDADKLLLKTLSGNGSRAVLTAGTGNDATYAIQGRQDLGNGIFTRALLDAFNQHSRSNDVLITVNDLFSDIEKSMAVFRAKQGNAPTPRLSLLQETDYRGTFVFLNAGARPARLTGEQSDALGIRPTAKSDGDIATEAARGIIEVFSGSAGRLSIDSQDMGQVFSGETRQFLKYSVGRHLVQLNTGEGEANISVETKEVTVEGGTVAYAAFGLKSPIDESGKTQVGIVVLQSVHELGGEVFIDGTRVGLVEKNSQLTVANVTAGPHKWRIGAATEGANGPLVVTPNETTYTVVATPEAPTLLVGTVQ